MKLSAFKCCLLISLLTHALLVAGFKYFTRGAAGQSLPASNDSAPAVLVVTTVPDAVAVTVLAQTENPREPEPQPPSPTTTASAEKILTPTLLPVEAIVASAVLKTVPTNPVDRVREPILSSPAITVADNKSETRFIFAEPKPVARVSPTPAVVTVNLDPMYGKNPKPPYPLFARQHHQEGMVWLRVVVSVDGRATKIELKKSSSFRALDDAALRAAREWEFTAARVGSQAVTSEIEFPIEFRLR